MKRDIDFFIDKKGSDLLQRLVNYYVIYEMLIEEEKKEISNITGNSFFNNILIGKYDSISIPLETFFFPNIQKISAKKVAGLDERIFWFKKTPDIVKKIENIYKSEYLVSGERNPNIEMFIQDDFIERGLSKIGMEVKGKRVYIDYKHCYIEITGDIHINSKSFLNMCYLDNPVINSLFQFSIVKERQSFIFTNIKDNVLKNVTFKVRGKDLYNFLNFIENTDTDNIVNHIQEEYNKLEISLKEVLDKCSVKIEKFLHAKGEFIIMQLDFSNSTLQLKDVLKTEVSPQLRYVFYHSVYNKDITLSFSNIKMLINEISRTGGAHDTK